MDPRPKDLAPDLAMARALLESSILEFAELREAILVWNRLGHEVGDRPQPLPVVGDLKAMLDTIGSLVMKMAKLDNEGAVSRSDFIRIMTEFGRIVNVHVEDEDTKKAIKTAWLQVRL